MSDDLLISLLSYDEVSALLLLVKARNSSLLTGRPICFLEVFKNKFTNKLISAVVNKFVLSTLEKYQQFSHMGPWSHSL